MTPEEKFARLTNIKVLMEAFPHLTESEATTMQDKLWGVAHRVRVAEARACNEEFEEGRRAVRDKAHKDVAKILERYKVHCLYNLSTDARGCGLWLHLPTKRFNTMGGEEAGWGF